MKPYERRAATAYPYYKLARWNPRNLCFDDGKRAFPAEVAARATATAPGKYRISEITDTGRRDLEPFAVE